MLLASCWPRCTEQFKSGKSGIPRFYEVCVKFCFARASLCSSFVVGGELFCLFVLNLVGLVVVCLSLSFVFCLLFCLFVVFCFVCFFFVCLLLFAWLLLFFVWFVCCCCFWLLFYGVLFAFFVCCCCRFLSSFLSSFFPTSLSSLFLFVCLLFSSPLSPFSYSSSFFLVGREI